MPANKSANAALSPIKPGLNVVLNDTKVETGDFVPKAQAQTPPSLTYAASPNTTYLIVALDMDAPFPSAGFLGPILHWIQPNYTGSSDGKLTTDAPFVADYIGPAPPPPSAPHRYCFFLYEQPEAFDAKKFAPAGGAKYSVWKRMRFDLDRFEREAGLGGILASTYFKSN